MKINHSFWFVAFFFVFYSFFGLFLVSNFSVVSASQDFDNHFDKACFGIGNYSPLYPAIFSQFCLSKARFYLANLLLIIIAIPIILYKIVKNNWVLFVYFFGVSLVHQAIYSATYPSILVLLFFLCYYYKRPSILWWIIFGILSSLTHSYGFELFFIIGVIELLLFLKSRFIIPYASLVSPVPIVLSPVYFDSLKTIFPFFLFQAPFPLFFGLKKIGLFGLLLAVASILACFSEARAIIIFQILLVIGVSKALPEMKKDFKTIFVILCLLLLVLYFFDYVLGTIRILNTA